MTEEIGATFAEHVAKLEGRQSYIIDLITDVIKAVARADIEKSDDDEDSSGAGGT